MNVWVVVLTWNGRADTLDLLAGLVRQPVQVLVVDNASSDGTLDAVAAAYPGVRRLQTGANLGYAGGNNAGIEYALRHDADVIGVLNNDTVVSPDFLGPLLAELDGDAPTAVSPDIRYVDDPDESWFRGARLDERRGLPVHLAPAEQPPPDADPFWTPYLTGCCIVATAATWRRVGLFDDGLFLMFEDSDWSRRAARAGVSLRVVPRSRIGHRVSRSFRGSASLLGSYYYARNGTVFAARHLGVPACARFVLRRVLRPSARLLVSPSEPGDRRRAVLALVGVVAAAARLRGAAGPRVARLARAR